MSAAPTDQRHDQTSAPHAALPLLGWTTPDATLIWQRDSRISAAEFLQQAQQLAQALPETRHAINLCESPYHFLLSFAAVLLRGQTNLLPPSRLPQALSDIQQRYDNHYVLDDALLMQLLAAPATSHNNASTWAVPSIASEHIAAVLFTSGSTGQSQPYTKPWRTLVAGATANAHAHSLYEFAATSDKPCVIGTVPSQHSYGLETLVMLPLQGYCALYAERPFYPQDIIHSVQHVVAERILVSTPVHLRALIETHTSLPDLNTIWSATAPLSTALATQIEMRLHTTLHEIFGCTETGTCATRRTAHTATWQLMPEFTLQTRDDASSAPSHDSLSHGALISAAHLPMSAWLQDQFRVLNDRQFELAGRGTDLINIAGKRASLADLNHRLLSIPGVIDGVIFLPDPATDAAPEAVLRTAALVVAPQLSRAQLLDELRNRIDPAFVPRPLWLVNALPRNEVGKLPRAVLLARLRELNHAR